jgi:hypothetical protein
MRKLSLELDELKVESFATGAAEPGGGTVRGRETGPDTCDDTCASGAETCGSCDPYASDCFETCGRSCFGSCWSCDAHVCP